MKFIYIAEVKLTGKDREKRNINISTYIRKHKSN